MDMKNVIERVSELEAALRKRSPGHDFGCEGRARVGPVREDIWPCTCGHDDAMKVLTDDQLTVSVGDYRFYQSHDGAVCVDLNGVFLTSFWRAGGPIMLLMRELLAARELRGDR